jgi:protein-disulfide isomerase
MKNSNKSFAIWMGVIFIGCLLLIVWSSSNKPSTGSSANTPTTPANVADIVSVKADDYVKGNPNGSVVLIEYLDFECEACRAYFPLVKQLEKDFPNDLKIVMRYFPLPSHRNAMPAALAVEAAGRQGKFIEMHDLLYTEQEKWGEKAVATPAVFEAYAQQLGLDMEKFKQDVASPEVKARVQRDVDGGMALGARGTPTFILNGEKIENPQGYEPFKALIEAKIKETKPEWGTTTE